MPDGKAQLTDRGCRIALHNMQVMGRVVIPGDRRHLTFQIMTASHGHRPLTEEPSGQTGGPRSSSSKSVVERIVQCTLIALIPRQ